MKRTKRKRNNTNYSNDKNKRKKLLEDRIISNNSNKSCFTHFEDLSNELIYEIFDFLDDYHIYKSFFDLNKRFKNLLIHSILPIKINILSMSKSNFEDYYINIIKSNKHRITLLCLSDLFILDIILSPPRNISKFIRLETLILDNIEAKHLENVLKYASSLPNLSSLIINNINSIFEHITNIYHQIFCLPALKYCKIPDCTTNDSKLLPNINNQYSPIEHLVIKSIDFDEFDILLSYVPQLRRLSLNCLNGAWSERTELSAIILNHLTYISIECHIIYFIQFEKLIKDCFNQVQVLRLTASRDITYVDAKRWEVLILSHMRNLRVFDVNYESSIHCEKLSRDVLTDDFNSSFWNERKSIFIYQQNGRGNISIKIFYSIDPFKKTNYRSFKIDETSSCLIQSKIIQNSVDHVYICNANALKNCENYFPNVTNLTFDYNFDTPYHSYTANLNRIISLSQVTTLVIKFHIMRFTELIEILHFASNLHILKLSFLSLSHTECTTIQQSESFIFVSNTNNIKMLSLIGQSTLEKVRFIVTLFPRLEHLSTGMVRKELESCVKLLLSKTNNNTSRLYHLCISSVPKLCLRQVKRLIKLEKLLDDFLIKYVNRDLYVWC